MKITTYLDNFLKSGQIFKDDIVLIHSDISQLYKILKREKFNFDINDIADFFINYFDPKGIMIIPTFNFDFCKGLDFSIKNTVSQMGTLSENLRHKAGKNRTWHPVYSFVIFGKVPKDLINKRNYSAYGKESIFHWITENDGKIGVIDLPDQKSMTYYHHVEESLNVNWRFMKTFEGNYTDFEDKTFKTEAKIFVRKISEGIVTKVNGMEKILWKKNLYKSKNKLSFKGCRSIKAKSLKKEVRK